MNNRAQDILSVNGKQLLGIYKGIAVDNRDPFGLGRIRIWCYPLHGDFTTFPISTLPWVEPSAALPGSFNPPPLFSRVLFGFENGHRDHPIYVGFWNGVPDGTGDLPFDRSEGTDVRPEGWHNHDLAPESLVVASSPEGNAIWMVQKFVGKKHLHSSIELMDTGSKCISIKSFHTDTDNYTANYVTIDSKKTLVEIGEESGPPNPTRDGTSLPVDATGFIDIGHTNLMRSMGCNEETFSYDTLTQYGTDDSGENGGGSGGASGDSEKVLRLETQAINADILLQRCDAAMMSMQGNSIFINGQNGVFLNKLVTPPRRYTTSE